MNLQEFIKLLRSRWVTVAAATLIVLFAAILRTLTTTPLYQASTRLFVSTTAQSVSDLYQGNRLSQDRVISYTELVTGETLAQRTIDKMGLDASPKSLSARVTATAKPDTVLIDVTVLDESPVRARDIANAMSDEFVVMVRELETPRPGATPDARVIVEQRASIPKSPAIPRQKRNIAAGLFGGLMLGVGLALLRDRLDNTVKRRDTLEEITKVGLVGSIPIDKDCRKEPAISFENNNSSIAESFRKLRTNLQFLNVDNPPRTIVITSSVPNEGKSTTAINIALALAEGEYNVVLVDGDMRRPSLDKYLDLVGSVGFSTVLSGGASLDDVLQATKFTRLTVLTAGSTPPNPSELLGSKAAKNVLRELRERFDYVIIDTSPLLAVTDGAILATNCDGALIIARFGESKRDSLSHAVTTLRNVGATLLGAVFSMTPSRGNAYYNYDYNYNYYGYGEERSPAPSPAPASSAAVLEAAPKGPAGESTDGEISSSVEDARERSEP